MPVPKDPAAYSAIVLADAPARYYKLNETGASNPADSSGNGDTGALGGSYVWGVDGQVQSALRFNGTDVRFTIARVGLTGDQTRIAWVKTTSTDNVASTPANPALTIFGDSTGSAWDAFGIQGGKARFARHNGTAWQYVDSVASVNDGNWHLIAVTYNATTRAVVIYVDGVSNGTGTITAHQTEGGVNRVGVGNGDLDWFAGDLDELEIFSSVLAPARIAARWDAPLAQPALAYAYENVGIEAVNTGKGLEYAYANVQVELLGPKDAWGRVAM